MTIQELFVRANEELQKVIRQIIDAQWSLGMPAGTSSKSTTLDDAVRYHAYDDAWVPDVLAGSTKEEVGEKYEALLAVPRSEILSTYAQYNARAIEAVRGFTELKRNVHLSYGDFPARDYLQHIISFRGFRTYDIAKLIGANTTMASDLVQGLRDEFTPVAEFYRQIGVFPPARAVPEDADMQTKLLGLVGRE